jgi:hypothetical protein
MLIHRPKQLGQAADRMVSSSNRDIGVKQEGHRGMAISWLGMTVFYWQARAGSSQVAFACQM